MQRLANPLVNELIIGTKDKDRWNGPEPEDESRFLGYYLKPRFALAEQLVFNTPTGCLIALPGCAPASPANTGLDLAGFNRTDLQALLLQYNPIVYGSGQGGANSDLLRLNLATPPTPLGQQSSVPGALGGDPAAWPNGRRPKDDVTDIAAKAVGGPNYLPLPTVDGVEDNDKAYPRGVPVPRLAARRRDAGAPEPLARSRWTGRSSPARPPNRSARPDEHALSEGRSPVDASQDRWSARRRDRARSGDRRHGERAPARQLHRQPLRGDRAAGDRVYVRYVLDLAEIPTFQFGDEVRAPGFATTVAKSLELRLDGRRVALRPLSRRVSPRDGAGA